MTFTFPTGLFGGNASAAKLVSFGSVNYNTSNPINTITAASQNFGSADATRYLVMILFGINANLVFDTNYATAVSMGGVAATRIYSPGTSSLLWWNVWVAAVPTGTSGTVSVTRSTGNGFEQALWSVFACYNLSSPTTYTAVANNTGNPTASSTLATASGGVLMAQAYKASASGFTWTNATKQVDQLAGVGNSYGLTAALANNTTGSNLTVSCTGSVQTEQFVLTMS